MSIEAMKQALDALETYHGYMEPLTTVFGGPRVPAEQSTTGKVEKAITSLRQAIAEAEKQEPVAEVLMHNGEKIIDASMAFFDSAPIGTVLYTHPQPKREPLTDEEIDSMVEVTDLSGAYYYDDLYAVVSAAEAKLKEKNT